MSSTASYLEATVDLLLETLPPVWDRIRTNLRAAAMTRFGITLEQFHTLRHIRQGYQSVKDLAEKRQISRPAISQAVDALAVKGLVTRTQESDDRRCVRLDLTPFASRILEENFEENRAWMRVKMASLSEEKLAAIKTAMETLRDVFTPGES